MDRHKPGRDGGTISKNVLILKERKRKVKRSGRSKKKRKRSTYSAGGTPFYAVQLKIST